MAERSKASDATPPRLIALGLALITLLLYLPTRQHEFIRLDDADYVAANPMVQAGLSWPSVAWAFTTYHANNWHPLTWLSHMLDWQLFGANAGAHHLVNALLHSLNAALWFWFWQRATKSLWPAAVIAALFAWHPLHVESVAWVAERKDVLSTLFFILTLLAYERYARARSGPMQPGIGTLVGNKSGGLVITFFALGLMAKPMLVTVPFVLLLLDHWPLERLPPLTNRRQLVALISEKIPLFILSAISCVLTYQAQRIDAVISLEQLPFPTRLGNALVSYATYLIKTFWPVDLAIFYPLPEELNRVHVMLAAVLLLGISVLVVRNFNSRRYLAIGWFWFLGTLVPVIGLLQVGEQALADRYTYIPLIGIFVAIAFGVRDFSGFLGAKKSFLPIATVAALAACLLITHKQIRYWRDSESLFRHALAATKNNAKAHQILGFALAGKGQQDDAVREFQIALQLAPKLHGAHNDLGVILQSRGQTNEALAHYQAAVRLRPQNATFQVNLGLLLDRMGRSAEAATCFTEAVRLEPQNAHYYYFRGGALQNQGRSAEALQDFREAARLSPDEVEIALSLCRLLAADPSPQIRNASEAVALAQRLNQLTRGEQVPVLDVLAMAYAEAGQYDRAAALLSRTLNQIPAANTDAFIRGMQTRFKLYKSNQPYRLGPQNPAPANTP